MRHGQRQYAAGPAGLAMLDRQCSFDDGRCAASAQEVMAELPRAIGSARNYLTRLRERGWYQLQSGDEPQADDVVVYDRYGRRGSRGYTHGHVGFIVVGEDGTPRVVSNLNGSLDVRDIGRGAVFFRPPSRAGTRAGARPQASDTRVLREGTTLYRQPGSGGFAKLTANERVTLTGTPREDDFVEVRTGAGGTGWVSASVLRYGR